jgi:hypothetical protein
MNLHISILAVISFTLLNCNVVNTLIETEKNDNFQSPEEFLWKSLVPFYMEEVFLRISSLDNYEEIIFAQVSEPCKVDSSEWISHLVNTTEPNLAEPWALTCESRLYCNFDISTSHYLVLKYNHICSNRRVGQAAKRDFEYRT